MTALRQTRFPHALALIAAAFLPLPALAQSTIYVAPCGDDAWTGSSAVCAAPDGPKSTLQAAINASNNGDTVIAADGTYTGAGNFNLAFGGRAITLRSSGGAAACIIDLQASTSAFRRGFIFSNGETGASILQGFTIRNGVESRGGAIYCENSSPLIRDCIFQQNTAWTQIDDDGGGAVYILGSQPTFINCEFVQNHVECHLPLADGGGMVSNNSSPTLIDCIFRQNTAAGPGGAGDTAGLSVYYGGHATILNCQFIGNHSTRCCGAAWIGTPGTQATIINSSFIGNTAANEGGGGVVVQWYAEASFTSCSFTGNSALGGGGLWVGDGGSIIARACTIRSNTVTGSGGGISLVRGGVAEVDSCTFTLNHASFGGGLFATVSPSTASVVGSTFQGNTAVTSGGGAYVQHGVFRFTNSLLRSNSANFGGGLWIGNSANATVSNCTIVNNSGPSGGGGIRLGGTAAAQAMLTNSIVWGNNPLQLSVASGTLTVAFSCLQQFWPGEGNLINIDPQFVDPGEDFRLMAASPCIDSGSNALVPHGILRDLDGELRFMSSGAPANRGRVDMGAYEFQFAPCYANCDGSTVQPILNVDDFTCFINEYAQAQSLPHAQQIGHYTNCDNSTAAPALNIDDFTCFINVYAQGCQ
jgi:hypothetical protein